MAFTRCDIQGLQEGEINCAAQQLGLPHLDVFLTSIGRAQATVADGTVRTYLRDLIWRGWFEIVSPNTGRILRSGCSVVLVEGNLFSVVFSFPEEPALFLAVGDLSQGFPVCAAILTVRELLLGLVVTPWGFSERQLANFADVIKATGWAPGPAAGVVNLVLGHPNFAHHAWNQLSALEEMVCADLPHGIRMVATHQPIGPIHEIFPELIHWPLLCTPITGLQALNAPGALFVPVGGRKIKASLVKRLLTFAEMRASAQCRAIRTAVSSVSGPVLWISVRTRNRTATNQHAVLTTLGNSFLKAAPNGAIIIDSFSLADDHAKQSPYYGFREYLGVVDEDQAAAEALLRALGGANPNKRVYVTAGLSISDSILLSQQADIYFCHHGTVQHKIGLFSAVPGVVHCNRAVLMSQPAAWMSAQSEVATPQLYLSSDLVQDVDAEVEANTEIAHLLHWENYTITDIPAAIATFFSHAGQAKVLNAAASEA